VGELSWNKCTARHKYVIAVFFLFFFLFYNDLPCFTPAGFIEVGDASMVYSQRDSVELLVFYRVEAGFIQVYNAPPSAASDASSFPLPFCPLPPALAYESVAAVDPGLFKQGLQVPVPEQLIKTPWIWLVCEAFLFALFIVSERSYVHFYEQFITLVRQVYKFYIRSENEFFFVAPQLPTVKPPHTARCTKSVKSNYRFLSFTDGFHRECVEPGCECVISTPFFCVCVDDIKSVLYSLCACASLDRNENFYCTRLDNNILIVWSYVCDFYDEDAHARLLEAIGTSMIYLCPTTMKALRERSIDDVQLVKLGENDWTSSIFPGPLSYLNIADWAQCAAEKRVKKLRNEIAHRGLEQYVKETQTTLLYDIAKRYVVPNLVLPQVSGFTLQRHQTANAAEATILNSIPLLVAFLASLEPPGKVVNESNARTQRIRLNGHTLFYPISQFWQDFRPAENNKGTGLLSLTRRLRGCDATSAADYIAAFLTAPVVVAPLPQSQRPAHNPQSLLSIATRLRLGGSGSLYLRGQRGLSDADTGLLEENSSILEVADLWYHSNVTNKAKRTNALLLVGPGGRYLQRVYITADGKKQTDAKPAKPSLGDIIIDGYTDGVILRLGTDGMCFVAEGPETALSVALAMPQSSVVCTLGITFIPSLRVPSGTNRVIVCRENDEAKKQVGTEVLLQKFRAKLRCAYAEVWPASTVKDFNDYHQRNPGSAGTREIYEAINLQLTRMKRPLDNAVSPPKRQAIGGI
jgi:hypothetical protein